jgi:thioredoxin-like negative regulator of GroEL
MSESDATATANRPVHLSDGTALEAVLSRDRVVLAEFYTEGCGICGRLEPVLGVVARQTDATVATINPRDDPPLVDRFDIQSVPLFVLFVDSEPVDRRAEGFVGADDLLTWIESSACGEPV